MPAHDANNATWYVLRYAEDFAPLAGAAKDPLLAPFAQPSSPYLQSTLLFDQRRNVLELQPEASRFAADPPPGIALDVDGDIYRVDETGTLVIVRCDGTSVPLPCEPGVLAQPAGLALDRRGYLYVADPAAHRVVVFDPDDATVRAILGGGGTVGSLVEPIDVATSPSGFVYVADRKGGRIAVFSARMKPLASFPTAAVPGKKPQPIAVMIDADANLLVADAWLPRLLSYAPDGTRLADVELATLVAPLAGGDLAMGALGRAYGDRMPCFLVGSCGPCGTPSDDGGARLAEVQLALRLLALSLGRHFEQAGVFISRALDGGRPDEPWHRVEVEFNGDPPPGARVFVETFTSDSPTPEVCACAGSLGSLLLSVGDFKDFNRLLSKLVGVTPDALASYLWARIPLASQTQVKDTTLSIDARKSALAAGLNTILQGASIYDAARFSFVTLSWETKAVLAQSPTGAAQLRLNRMLLEDAYPLEIARNPWTAPRDEAGAAIPFTSDRPEQLVQALPGRFLWLRVTLFTEDGHGTPSVRAIRVWYPRVSWLDLLPTAFRRDPDSTSFLDHFLALFEHVFTGVEDRYEEFSRELNLDAAPLDVIDWLATLVDLAFDPSWPIERRRALVGEAMSLYRARGTIAGIERYVEVYTGNRPEILEAWLERPARPTFLGRPGSVLGCGMPLLGCGPSPAILPDDELWARYAHRFTIFVYVHNRCDAEVTLRAIDRIVEANKPAHTTHRCEAIYPDARVGIQSRVGLDLVLGAATASATRLGESRHLGTAIGATAGVLGVDSVLGSRRPEYLHRFDGGS